MNKFLLGMDAGTTNIRSMVVDDSGRVVGRAKAKCRLNYPRPGHVEQDPEVLWSIAMDTVGKALADAEVHPRDVAAVGITGQRSSIVIWERETGRPLGPVIIWQDLRGAVRAKELNEKGYITVNALSAASKLEPALTAIPDGWKRMRNNELAWGNVDSYIAFRMSGGTVHATDASNACGTGYFDLLTGWKWFDDLLEEQGLLPSFFPEVMDTAGIFGYTAAKVFGATVPIGAMIGDQQSAAYAQGCLTPGEAKISFGTSATCDVNTGDEIRLATGSYPFVMWFRENRKTFCLEGMVITAGAVFDWLAAVGILKSHDEAEKTAGQAANAGGIRFLPALQGLGTPHNQYDRYGAFHNLTLAASKANIVHAAMEGVSFRVREMLERIYLDSGLPAQDTLRVDGGAAMNVAFMQVLSNITGLLIERMDPVEATAYGAALLAGEACGIWAPFSSGRIRKVDRVFSPAWSQSRRDEEFHDWKKSFGLA
jgi:glycerol kinase